MRNAPWMWMCGGVAAAGQALLASAGMAQSVTMEIIEPSSADGRQFEVSAISQDRSTLVGALGGPLIGGPWAAYWTEATGIVLIGDTPSGGKTTRAAAVSADGSVITGEGRKEAGPSPSRGFYWTKATGAQDLPMPAQYVGDDRALSLGKSITPDGSIILGTAGHAGFGAQSFATLWTDLAPVRTDYNFDAIDISADGSVICGVGTGPFDAQAWIWEVGAPQREYLGRAPGSIDWFTYAWAMSADGSTIVGEYHAPPTTTFLPWAVGTFIWRAGIGMVSVGFLPGALDMMFRSVTADGALAYGWANFQGGAQAPLVWDRANGARKLLDVLRDEYGFEPGDYTLRYVEAISPDGAVLAGQAYDPAGERVTFLLRLNGGCYADCDGSGELDFFDFLCFQNLFAAGDPAADCDESGGLDFFDFLCFQNAFAAGCQ